MKITLRRAKAIQTNILETIDALKCHYHVELIDYLDMDALIQRTYNQTMAIDARRNKLTLALYTIRDMVGTANASSGIDSLLTQMAYIDRRIKQLTEFASAPEMMHKNLRDQRIAQITREREGVEPTRNQLSTSQRHTSIFTAVHIAEFKSEMTKLKRQRQGMNDKVLHLNITTTIELSDDIVELLRDEEIL